MLTWLYTITMKKPSIYDIAKRVGVSVASVSYVLNGKEGKVSAETKKKIFKAMHELGYTRNHAALSLSTGKSHLIGISFALNSTAEAFLNNPFYAEFLGAFEETIQSSGYDVIIGSSKSAEEFETWYKSRALDGILILGCLSKEIEDVLLKIKAPTVLVDVYEEYNAPFTNIRINDERGEYLATEHLISLGHKKIGYLGGPDYSIVNHTRYCGFEKAMNEKGYKIDQDCVFHTLTTLEGGYSMGDKIAEKLDRMSAIVVDADIVAIGLMRRLLELGIKLPEQLSIIGFDDIQPARYIYPTLTTIHQDIKEKSRLSAEAIVDRIDSMEPNSRTIVIEPSLTIGKSTMKA